MLLDPMCAACGLRRGAVCGPCAASLAPARSLALPLGVDVCSALLDYADARPLLTSLKNGDRRDLVGWLAARMAPRVVPPAGAVVSWAPTSTVRRRHRGYDQAELLARALARRWRLPCTALLLREPGPAQAGRAAQDRRGNPSFRPRRTSPEVVVLVDDVVTTGSTLTAAARALRTGGTRTVLAAVAARAAGHGVR